MNLLLDNAFRESGADFFELPQRSRYNGPVAARRLRRALAGYLIIAVLGLLPTVLEIPMPWQALGLGLVLPGGGFLLFGWWAALGLGLTLLFFAVALLLWFGTGNALAPTITWLGAAALAAALAAGHPQPQPRFGALLSALVIVGAIAALAVIRRVLAVRRADRVRAERTAYLPGDLDVFSRRITAGATGPRELDDHQLGHVRWLLALGLQPVDEFDGFDVIEQFQPSALRYQINHVQYALAQVQRHYTPNFGGYLSEAQEQLIEKLTVPKVWKYWRLERLWGRLSTNYDPAGFENIMLTGWSGICLNTFHANTGSNRFVGPNSLEFGLGNPKKTYRHDTRSFNDSLLWNFDRSPQTVFACEPNWTYSACNIYGLNSVASYDAAFGTHHLEALREPFLRGLREELMNPGGDIIPFRSDFTGISIPFGGELMYFQAAGWIAPVYPQLARTLWTIGCHEILRVHDGGLEDYLAKPFGLDAGNYRNTGLFARAMILLAAREFGDDVVADAAERAMNEHNQPVEFDGMRRFEVGSTYANALAAQALLTRRGDWSRLITAPAPASALAGPILKAVRFDQVMVAKALSDGTDLRLVLRAASGLKSTDEVALELARLRPLTRYSIDGDGIDRHFETDHQGEAVVSIGVDSRAALRIRPLP